MGRTINTQKINRRSQAEDEFEDRIDVLRSRVNLLTGRDRTLMKMYLDNDAHFSQMARLAGVNEANIARRISKLTRRLLDGQYITCLRNRDRMTQTQLKIAKDYFVAGLPMRKIALNNGTTYYQVRKAMKLIQRLTAVKP